MRENFPSQDTTYNACVNGCERNIQKKKQKSVYKLIRHIYFVATLDNWYFQVIEMKMKMWKVDSAEIS